ncbi:HAD-IIA family hydrolase [Roseiflexus sp.]|uniref:HAD-IIA family hydrolase n=1 Tax=Roseiflexus sp. TaxID=2562120 RepID=UPI0021DBF858|nr:HAD-IIA family hydrolase [Roseiflexus sp.]GIW00827.1 MAG: acid sugar phosphatase [Roseiflexus sp.]
MPIPHYNAYIFDLDGTVYLGDALLPGAAEAITRLRAAGSKVVFLSNNPTRTRAQYAAKLTALGIPTMADEVINSSYVLVRWLLAEAPGSRVFVVGEPPLCDELRTAGFDLADDADGVRFVIASFDRTFTYRKLQIAFDAIRAGARFVATNPDRYCPTPTGGEPDAAAMIAAIEACTAHPVEVVVGKPSPIMVQTIAETLRLPPAQCLVVGDRLETDIAMGRAAGMATALTLTGATDRRALAEATIQPDYVIESLGALIE